MFYIDKSKAQNLGKSTQRKSWDFFFFKQIEKNFFFFFFFVLLEIAFLFKVGSYICIYRSHKAMGGTAQEVALPCTECLLIMITPQY